MNRPPKITDRVLWVAETKLSGDPQNLLKKHTLACACSAPAHASPYREVDGSYSCPITRVPLPLGGLAKYTPPARLTEVWPVQTGGNVAHYVAKANEMGLSGTRISQLVWTDARRQCIDVTYQRDEDAALKLWSQRVAEVEKVEIEFASSIVPYALSVAERAYQRTEARIAQLATRRTEVCERLDRYRKVRDYYARGLAPDKEPAQEAAPSPLATDMPDKSPPHLLFRDLPVGTSFTFVFAQPPALGDEIVCVKRGRNLYSYRSALVKLVDHNRPVAVVSDQKGERDEPAGVPTPSEVKVHNPDTLNKFAPDSTRRTFGDVPMGAFFYYCSPEIDYRVAPGATAWQRTSHTEALPVAFIYRTDKEALKVSPTRFNLHDRVSGVKVSQ